MSEATANPSSVGRSPPRVDGLAKVTGAARYVDDLAVPGVLHGRTVRSTTAHGVLRAIHLDPDFDWGGVTVVTAEDIPGRNVIALIEDDQPALVPVGGTIRHVHEPVALVAASTRARARAALAHVTLDVEERPAVLTIDDALAADVVIHGDDNVLKRLEIHKGDDIDAALARCDHVVESVYTTGAQEQMYIEPQGMIAQWDGDTCRVTGSMQCPYYVHTALVALLGQSGDRVVVTQSVTGGGFGGKEEYPSMLAAHAALLSRKARAPVKMIYDRAEDIAATTKRHPARIAHRLGFMDDGTLVAADIDVVMDGGAYVTLSPVVLSRGILHAAGPYRLSHVRIVGRAVATNVPPHGAFRGFGAPQTTFAYERQVQKAARLLGVDPLELRRRNRLRLGDRTATDQLLEESVGSAEVLDAISSLPPRKEAEPTRLGTFGGAWRRGRGLAFYNHGAGFTGSGEQRLKGQATVATRADGDFEVRSSSTDIGQGTLTIFAQIAASALGVPVERVQVCEPTTERVPDSGPTVASRTCMVVGGVVERAAKALRERLVAFGEERGGEAGREATRGDRAQGDVGRGGADTDRNEPVVDLVDVARRYHAERGEAAETVTYAPPPNVQWDDDTYTGSAYPVYGWAACLVELAVDEDTWEVVIERCVHAVDIGKAIHPTLVRGQIEGGTLQALGWALWEAVPYGDGRPLNPSMTDCIIPTSFDAPELETVLVEVPFSHGPHGAKGVGEIPMDGPAAAVANALEDALGVPFDELPILPEVVERTLARHGSAG